MQRSFLQYLERQAQRAQGKGFGAKSHDVEVRAALPFLPKTDAVVFDVGANRGLWARALLDAAGARVGIVYCIEPSRHNHPVLAALPDKQVILIKEALSDSAGRQMLRSDIEGSGIASLAERNLDHYGISMNLQEEVSVTTLDAIIAERRITRIDFAKFDVEGYEYKAFLGGENALSSGVVRALAFEFGGCNIDTRTYFRDFWYFLTERNYAIARIRPAGRPKRIAQYHESEENFLVSNFIAWRIDIFPDGAG